jgi:hypothetical protein
MRLIAAGILLALAAQADIVTLKNGRVVNGTYLGGTPRQVKVEVGDEIETLDITDIARIEFGNVSTSSPRSESRSDERPTLRRSGSPQAGPVSGPIAGPASPPVMIQPDPSDPRTQSGSGGGGGFGSDRPTLRRNTGSASDTSSAQSNDSSRPTLRRAPGSDSDSPAAQTQADDGNRPTLRRAPGSASDAPAAAGNPAGNRATPAAAPAAAPVQIPAPTSMVVRLIDAIDSEKAKEGDTFAASLDQPIAIDGQVVLPAGTDVKVKLVQAKQSGKLTGKTELTVSLWSLNLNGKTIEIDTQEITEASASRGAKTAKVAGGAAAVGAVIGAVAGGGKGAAIGAGAGAAGGTAVQAATKGQRVKIASETLLTFVLEKPVTI